MANALGITRVTVTRAIGDSPLVSVETRTRVRALCEELGYQPHYMSRGLMSRKSMVLSAVHCDYRLSDLHGQWVSCLQNEAEGAGYMLRVDSARNFRKIVADGSADGFLVFDNLRWRPPELAELEPSDGTPVSAVILDSPEDLPSAGAVYTDNPGGGRLAAEHLLDLGHRKVGFVGVSDWGVGGERFAAFRERLLQGGVRHDDIACISTEWWMQDPEEIVALREPLMDTVSGGVTALFASSDLYAAGAMRILWEHGLSVPRDVSVIGYDNSMVARAYTPPLTSVMQDVAEAARVAVDMLVSNITGGVPLRLGRIPATLMCRGTTRPPRANLQIQGRK